MEREEVAVEDMRAEHEKKLPVCLSGLRIVTCEENLVRWEPIGLRGLLVLQVLLRDIGLELCMSGMRLWEPIRQRQLFR